MTMYASPQASKASAAKAESISSSSISYAMLVSFLSFCSKKQILTLIPDNIPLAASAAGFKNAKSSSSPTSARALRMAFEVPNPLEAMYPAVGFLLPSPLVFIFQESGICMRWGWAHSDPDLTGRHEAFRLGPRTFYGTEARYQFLPSENSSG